jgi:hypothetical protein
LSKQAGTYELGGAIMWFLVAITAAITVTVIAMWKVASMVAVALWNWGQTHWEARNAD